MVGPNGEDCMKCYYFEKDSLHDKDGHLGHGYCHRFPPTNTQALSTSVQKINWCGEFKHR